MPVGASLAFGSAIAACAFSNSLIDQVRYDQMKVFLLTFAQGSSERLAKIANATTLTDIQRVFIEMMDESMAASTH
jgi:hypothetical protein